MDKEVAAILAQDDSELKDTPRVSSPRSVEATRATPTTLSKDVSTPPGESTPPLLETPPRETKQVDLEAAAPVLSKLVRVLTQIQDRAIPTAFGMMKAGQGLHLAAAFV